MMRGRTASLARREKLLTHRALQNREHGIRIHVYRAAAGGLP